VILYHSNLPADFQVELELGIAEIKIISNSKNFKRIRVRAYNLPSLFI